MNIVMSSSDTTKTFAGKVVFFIIFHYLGKDSGEPRHHVRREQQRRLETTRLEDLPLQPGGGRELLQPNDRLH